jgi:hypothetical protein
MENLLGLCILIVILVFAEVALATFLLRICEEEEQSKKRGICVCLLFFD